MSAATELDAIFDHVSTNISKLVTDSSTLISDAIAVVNNSVALTNTAGVAPANTVSAVYDPAINLPQAFPNWADFPAVTFPSLQAVDPIVFSSQSVFPYLTIDDNNYSIPAALGDFSSAAPAVSADFTLPAAPSVDRTMALPTRPTLTDITLPDFRLDPPQFAPTAIDASIDPDTFQASLQQFSLDIFNGAGGLPGLESLLRDASAWGDQVLNTVTPLLLDQINQHITDRYAPVLAFQTQLRQRLTDRLNTETQRVQQTLQNRSGWDLPAAVQQALAATVDQVAYAWSQQAESLADTQTAELALAFFEACGEWFDTLNNSVQSFKNKELEYTLKAHRMSLAYARSVIAALLSQYELDNFTQQDVAFKNAEAQLKLFEAELEVALFRYEIAKTQLQAEQSQQDNDAALIDLYRSETEAASADIKIYAEQVAAARSELELKTLPVEIFSLEVKAFEARISAYESQLAAQVAELESDQARIDTQLAKVKLFEAQVKSFEQLMTIRSEIVKAQENRNEAVLAEFTARVDEKLYEAKQILSKNKYDVAKFRVLANDSLADANYNLTEARTLMKYNRENQDNLMKAYRLNKEHNLDLANAELERITAIAEVNATGASIMAQMATGAMSAATGIANVVLQETA